jgi:hypothetical protein
MQQCTALGHQFQAQTAVHTQLHTTLTLSVCLLAQQTPDGKQLFSTQSVCADPISYGS